MTSAEPSTLPSGQARLVPPAAVSLILSAMTIYGGHIVDDVPINQHVVVGGGFVILSLAVVNTISPGLADVFALLLFVAVFLKYGLGILVAIGIAAGGSSDGTT